MLLAGSFLVLLIAGFTGLLPLLAQLSSQASAKQIDPGRVVYFIITTWALIILMGLVVGPLFHALITNLIWSNTRLGEHRIECRMSALRLIWITVSNFVLVVVTLGFFAPWAMVRMARFQADSIRLLAASDLQEFVAAEHEAIGAFGEEAASIFDIDIAL